MKKTTFATVSTLYGMVEATNMKRAQVMAQVDQSSPVNLDICDTWEDDNDVELSPEECLRVIVTDQLQVMNSDGELDPRELEERDYAEWIRLHTNN